jgi:hypothetical protein
MNDLYQEHVLNNPEVCSNCLRRVREPRLQRDPSLTRSDVSVETAPTTRVRSTTTVEHVPGGVVTDDHGTFCRCGVESTFHRERPKWEDAVRVRELAKHCSDTLDDLEVSHDRRTFFTWVCELTGTGDIDRWRMTDEILATALALAVARSSTASSRTRRRAGVTGD